jgi:hypothetical protein
MIPTKHPVSLVPIQTNWYPHDITPLQDRPGVYKVRPSKDAPNLNATSFFYAHWNGYAWGYSANTKEQAEKTYVKFGIAKQYQARVWCGLTKFGRFCMT